MVAALGWVIIFRLASAGARQKDARWNMITQPLRGKALNGERQCGGCRIVGEGKVFAV